MDAIKLLSNDVYEELDKNQDPHTWSRCFFKTLSKCDSVDNNMSEAFNAWILKARYKTIIFMLEDIRRLVMIRLQKNRDLMRTNQLPFGKRIHTKLNNFILQSRYCSCIWNGDNKYEVRDDKYDVVTVDIDFKSCTCKKWDLTGIPCEHAVNVLHSMRLQPQDFVDKCYSKETYLMSYQNMLTPHNGMSFWPEDNRAPIRPPLIRKMPGKPKKNRRKEVGEESKKPTKTNRVNTDGEASQVSKSSRKGYQVKCSICKVSGHNKLRCPMKPAGEPSIKRKPRQKQQQQQYDEATASTAWARTGPTGPVGQK